MMRRDTPLFELATNKYPQLRSQFPLEGRRKRCLRLAEEFWATLSSRIPGPGPSPGLDEPIADEDPYDDLTNGPELGILLRTDYSSEGAWQTFLARLQESERDLVDNPDAIEQPEGLPAVSQNDSADNSRGAHTASQTQDDVDMDEENTDGDADDNDEQFDSSIFKIINPASTQDRDALSNLSNLAALRLLNDVDIRPSPERPRDRPRVNPPNRLIDHGGWQEIYVGKPVWIYDSKSNADQSVRVVSQQGDVYGTATADSWRARVSHICDLQINMYNGMKVDFGGLDGWDYHERRRNTDDVSLPI